MTKSILGGYVVNLSITLAADIAADGTLDLSPHHPRIAPSGAEPFLAEQGATVVTTGLLGATSYVATDPGAGSVQTYVAAELTVAAEAANLNAGEICRVDHDTIRIGTALVDGDRLDFSYIAAPVRQQVT